MHLSSIFRLFAKPMPDFQEAYFLRLLSCKPHTGRRESQRLSPTAGQAASFDVFNFMDGKRFALEVSLQSGDQTYNTEIKAERVGPERVKITAVTFGGRKEDLQNARETALVLREIGAQIRAIQRGLMPPLPGNKGWLGPAGRFASHFLPRAEPAIL